MIQQSAQICTVAKQLLGFQQVEKDFQTLFTLASYLDMEWKLCWSPWPIYMGSPQGECIPPDLSGPLR